MMPSDLPSDAIRGTRLSDHPHPRPALRRITAGLVVFGLAGVGCGGAGLLVAGIGLGLPLLVLMIPFLAALGVPLVQLAVLHPYVTVYEQGLWLRPLVGRGCWVPWEAIHRIETHTLIQRSPRTARDTPRDGRLIIVRHGLSLPFIVVGIMAGLGTVRAFGIATHSHVDYAALLQTIQRHAPAGSAHREKIN